MAFLAAAGAQVIGGLIGAYTANQQAKRSQRKADEFQAQLDEALDNRPEVQNLSGQIQNQYANLQVATGAAEMQAEESDVSLANTLDTLRATGMGAGGATALAQAALRSKRGVSANIEQQEAKNAELRARGAQQAQKERIAQANKEFEIRDDRSQQAIDRASDLLDAQNQQTQMARRDRDASLAGAVGFGLGTLGGSAKFPQRALKVPTTTNSTNTSGTVDQVTQGAKSLNLEEGVYRGSGF